VCTPIDRRLAIFFRHFTVRLSAVRNTRAARSPNAAAGRPTGLLSAERRRRRRRGVRGNRRRRRERTLLIDRLFPPPSGASYRQYGCGPKRTRPPF